MHLQNSSGEDVTPAGGQLAVPVKITLPVPDSIDPDCLVVLHRHSDGSFEEISSPRLYVSREGETAFVSFVVHDFSDFALAERFEASAARVDGAINVQLRLDDTPGAGQAFCAAYSWDGQMLGVVNCPVTGDTQELTLPCDSDQAVTVKAILLDGNGSPLSEQLTIPVQ